MSAPQPIKPAYLGPAGAAKEPPSAWELVKHQVMAPEYRDGNLMIARAVGLFAVGIVFVRSGLSNALVPAF